MTTQINELIKKTCRESVAGLPRRLVKGNDFNHLPEREKEAQIKDAEKDIRGWMIKVLTENEGGMDIIKEIAREKLGMVEATVMPANIVASLFKLTNMLPTTFRKLKSAVQTFWGRRMFASAEKSVS